MLGDVMERVRRVLLAAMLAGTGLVLFGPSPAAYACSCAQVPLAERAEMADVVVSGVLVAVEADGVPLDEPPSSENLPEGLPSTLTYLVEPELVWAERQIPRPLEVLSAASGASCGLEGLELGVVYAFFLTDDDGTYRTGLCSGTRQSGAAFERRLSEVLGDPFPVTTARSARLTKVGSDEPTAFVDLAMPGVIGVGVGLLGLIFLQILRRLRS
ncbi:hypothetical protein [Nocardioides limicola]|uniref:hypothetical protein n=1 Tax=Nocardioides limicola TaxID=2803368 RepID=UPI00193B13F6|nr:hypothetical protein [Nocardioides sp. DJM-14]